MSLHRRTILRLGGIGLVGSLAGCIAEDNVPSGGGGSSDATIAEVDTTPLTLRTRRPLWDEEDDVTGRAIIIDSEARLDGVLTMFDIGEERRDELDTFLDGLDYEDERVILIESTGPNLCHRTLDVEAVTVETGEITAEATVVDTSEEGEGCPQAVGYPAVLVRVTFDAETVDSTSVSLTDGWGETSTVAADVADPLTPDPADLTGYVQPDGSATPIDPLECDDESFDRLDAWLDEDALSLGDRDVDGEPTLALRVNERSFERGDTVTINLTNVSLRNVVTGNRMKFNLQVYTDEGWQEVRGSDGDPIEYTDEGLIHPPGGGFEWSFDLSSDGIDEVSHHNLSVCPALTAGRYRFAYFGIGGGAIAVEFDLAE